jgi:hypothetical protein
MERYNNPIRKSSQHFSLYTYINKNYGDKVKRIDMFKIGKKISL